MKDKRKEILDHSHLNSTNELARIYFRESGINFSNLEMKAFEELQLLIQIEIDKLLDDTSYRMITELKVKPIIQRTRYSEHGIFLRISGSYFSDREAISFWTNPLKIGFCGEMSGCNRIPFITGFIKWVDLLKRRIVT